MLTFQFKAGIWKKRLLQLFTTKTQCCVMRWSPDIRGQPPCWLPQTTDKVSALVSCWSGILVWKKMKVIQLSLLLSGKYKQIYIVLKVRNVLFEGSFLHYVLNYCLCVHVCFKHSICASRWFVLRFVLNEWLLLHSTTIVGGCYGQ